MTFFALPALPHFCNVPPGNKLLMAPGALKRLIKIGTGTLILLITSAKGEPLAGVSITLKGTSTGTSTDATGKFSINVAPNSTLIVSSVGFKTREVLVKRLTTINVTLEYLDQALGEVIVTALGMKR